ncbi:CoA transferase [Rhodobacteraceae bacterium M382]|nr:CoA transferase [Rhodobacteraceae bacterium M382]
MRVEIDQNLRGPVPDRIAVQMRGEAAFASCFATDELALESLSAAARALAALTGVSGVEIDRRLALKWFDMTLRPSGWTIPSAWDPIAGDYQAADGWVRLHTNAPHHRDAALEVLGCAPDRDSVARAVLCWDKADLEQAVAVAGGCSAAMHTLDHWVAHPQGQAVAREPLVAWETHEHGRAAVADLSDVKVLDLTRVLAGPVATRFLAGFGAQVLRIDPPSWGEPGVEPEVTLGKRCAGLELRDRNDRTTFERLLGQADILIHGYRPGALARLGYDTLDLQRLSPGLIDVSLCAYGWTGPMAGRRGFDSLVQMSSGIAAEGMMRAGAERPVPLPVQALDHATGYLMAAAGLRALSWRNHGRGGASARLSLARTAGLLTGTGARTFSTDTIGAEMDADLSQDVEYTGWGTAYRVKFPLTVAGVGPTWRYPAGPLRRDGATWE